MTILVGKGYTKEQIDNWPRLTSQHRLQGLYWAFVHGAGLHSFDDRWVNKLDQREALKDPAMMIDDTGGGLQGLGDPGFIKVGRLNSTEDTWNRDTRL